MKKITITVNDNGITKLELERFKTIAEFMDTMVGGMLQMMETHAHCIHLKQQMLSCRLYVHINELYLRKTAYHRMKLEYI